VGYSCASMDLMEDTALAIQHFERFKIEGTDRHDELGEKYLRLYGLLNAVYLQQNAALNMYEVFRVSSKSDLKSKIDTLGITQVRHKLASHTLNYEDFDNKGTDFFIIVRAELKGDKVAFQSYLTGKSNIVNLSELLNDHTEIMITALDNICEKSINTLYKTNPDKQTEFDQKLKLVRLERDGDVVVRTPEQDIVIKISHRKDP
jgi:hypothetical protein